MNLKILISLILISLAAPVRAEQICYDDRKWTTANSIMLGLQLTLTTMDIAQTQYFTSKGYAETNPLLPSHPSRIQVTGIWIGSMALQTVTAYLLPRPYREYFQIGAIIVEADAVTWNYVNGWRMTVPF